MAQKSDNFNAAWQLLLNQNVVTLPERRYILDRSTREVCIAICHLFVSGYKDIHLSINALVAMTRTMHRSGDSTFQDS